MAAVVRCIWPQIQRNISILHRSAPIHLSRSFRTSVSSHGLEEFFPPGVLDKGELAPEVVKTGRRWRAGELRIKSNEDLQKLWYVLLKERNMLNTLRHEAKRQGVPMPSPERYHKVKKSMAAIKLVLGERERALEDLQSQVWALDIQAEEETDKTLLSTSEDFNSQSVEQQPIQRDIAAVHMTDTSSTHNEQAQALHVDENKAFTGNLRPT